MTPEKTRYNMCEKNTLSAFRAQTKPMAAEWIYQYNQGRETAMPDFVILHKRVVRIILWANGMVMTFDSLGEQMPRYQGPYDNAIKNLREDGRDLSGVLFEFGVWGKERVTITAKRFFEAVSIDGVWLPGDP
jgi:hypothetical protein